MTMTPRERVLAAVNHEEPDRVPIVLGASNATGIKMKPYRELKQQLGIDAPDATSTTGRNWARPHRTRQTLVRLRSDVRGVLDLEPASVLERERIASAARRLHQLVGVRRRRDPSGRMVPDGRARWPSATTVEEIEATPGPTWTTRPGSRTSRREATRLARRGSLRDHGHALAAVPPGARVRDAGDGHVPDEHGPASGFRRGAAVEDRRSGARC